MPEDRRHAAMMFTDIVGYTALMGSDEDKAFDMLRRNHEIHDNLIKQFNGTLIKEIGDGTLVSFSLASDAVRCAMEIQKACKEQKILLKIGIHEGEMVFAGTDVLGDGVNIASRLQESAEEGCITISGSVYRDIKNKAGIRTEFIEERSFKNVDEPIKVYNVLFKEKEKEVSKEPPTQQTFKKSKLSYYIIAGLIVIIAALLIWRILPITSLKSTNRVAEIMDKSIAVLPFANDSPDQENEYFCNGMMEDILTNLQRISDLKVKSRNDIEQYRDNKKTIAAMGAELGVAYILEGSVRKAGDNLRITAQLIDVKTGDHLWANTYDGNYSDEIFNFQSEVAEKVASSLKAVITPEEKQKIAAVPTTDMTAYEFILQARAEQWKYWSTRDTVALKRAENLYNEVLKIDPNYSLGWVKKGSIYWDRIDGSEGYYNENYLDSVIWYCNKAQEINQNQAAYHLLAMVDHRKGNIESAIDNYEKAIEIATIQNDNSAAWESLWRLGYIYLNRKDYIKGISLIKEAVQLAKGSPFDYRHMLFRLAYAYLYMGAFEEAEKYIPKVKNLYGSTTLTCYLYAYQGDFQKAIDCSMNDCPGSDDICDYIKANNYLQLSDFESAAKYFRDYRIRINELGYKIDINYLYREGYALIQTGNQEEGMRLIEEQLSILDKSKKLGRSDGYDYHYAAIYALLSDYTKALQHLKNYEKAVIFPNPSRNTIPIYYIQYDILFDNLRDDPQFKAVVKRAQDEKAAIRAQVQEMVESGEINL